jgi:cell division protein FtsX
MRNRVLLYGAGLGSLLSVLVAGVASASGATYDITPVTSGVTSELVANIPIILACVGTLIALAIAVRIVRKFVKA